MITTKRESIYLKYIHFKEMYRTCKTKFNEHNIISKEIWLKESPAEYIIAIVNVNSFLKRTFEESSLLSETKAEITLI